MGPLKPNIEYTFTLTGTGLYNAFVGSTAQPAATFNPSIVDNVNGASVLWGSYNYAPVQKVTGSDDIFVFKATYNVPTGATPTTPGSLTITVTLLPLFYNACNGANYTNQAVNYQFS